MFDYEDYYSLSPQDQFKHPMIIEIPAPQPELGDDGLPTGPEGPSEIMQVYDIMPSIIEHDVPILFVPGWAGTIEGMRDNMLSMVEKGWRTLAVSSLRGINPSETMPGFPLYQARKMSALLKGLEVKEIDQVDVVAHSAGAIFTVMAAARHPERFRNLILVAPAGLMGPDSLQRLIAGFSRDVFEQLAQGAKDKRQKDKAWNSVLQMARAMRDWKNFKLSVNEVQSIIDSYIGQLLIGLKENGHRIVIIHDVEDQEFPISQLLRIVRPSMVHGFLAVRGHHHDMFAQPELYSKIFNDLLLGMERYPQ